MVFCNFSTVIKYIYKQCVTILILIDGFLQYKYSGLTRAERRVTILILIDGFLQYKYVDRKNKHDFVTILILIDGFLQWVKNGNKQICYACVTILILIDGFLQSKYNDLKREYKKCHNPYFNRWFSAIL